MRSDDMHLAMQIEASQQVDNLPAILNEADKNENIWELCFASDVESNEENDFTVLLMVRYYLRNLR